MKTTAEIIGEHQRNAGEIMLGYEDAKQEIREGLQLEEGGYLERLTPEQRFAALREQKIERSQEAHRQTLEAYTAELERYHDELASRRTYLRVHFNTHRADNCSRLASRPSRGKPGGCPPCARSEPSAFGSGIATRNSAPPPSGDDRASRCSLYPAGLCVP